MLHLILGRANTGKSTHIFKQVQAASGQRPQIIIVPEQYSHDTERRLCALVGNRSAANCEVLSFTRLCNRIMTEAGGLAEQVLDAGGRLLLMHEAVQSVRSGLKVYARPSQKAAFLQQLLSTADELKSYCILPEQLVATQGERLGDLGLIFGTYDTLVSQRASDPRDRLTRTADRLSECEYGRGYDIYLDCFSDFTPQQRRMLRSLLPRVHSMTAVLTCDTLNPDGEGIFETARRTAESLLRLAQEVHVAADFVTLEQRIDDALEALRHLERYLMAGEQRPTDAPFDCIRMVNADSPYGEVESAAGEIRRLVQKEGYRYRDIVVAARSIDGYLGLIESVFRRYEIPVFLGRMDSVLDKPVLTLLTAALEAVDGYEYDAVFRYLKTGLAGVSPDEVDELENYVLHWDIRGQRWTREADWDWHPDGYALPWKDEDTALVQRLDQLRRRIVSPLEQLRKIPDGTGSQQAQALFAFLETIELPGRLTERAEVLQKQGELGQAEEYRQLWDILCTALEQCAWLMGDAVLRRTDFADLFRLMLSQYEVGSIPVSLDRVSVGDGQRFVHKQVKVLFLLGMDDSHVPLVSEGQGLLTDEDRALLVLSGCEVGPTTERRLDREMTMVYDSVTIPTEKLFLSWSARSSGGEDCRPAFVISRIQTLFPGLTAMRPDDSLRRTAPVPALEWAAQHGDEVLFDALSADPDWHSRTEQLRKAAQLRRGSLSPEAVKELYGSRVKLSASRIDTMKSCHFSYFMQYGLKAKTRKKAGFDAPLTGTFYHYVLEQVFQAVKGAGGMAQVDTPRLQALTASAVEQYVQQELGGLENKTPRFRYLFRRLLDEVQMIVANVAEELKDSEFEPIEFELGFGTGQELPPVTVKSSGITLSITGFVDRVDGWVKGNRIYLRVVDYKTGKKSFSLTDVWHGLEMQMLLYLFTLESSQRYDKQPISAGVLYLPARDFVLSGSRDMTAEERQKAAEAQLRRSGMVLDDPAVLEAMEPIEAGESGRFLPVHMRKNGSFSGDSLATAEQWGLLRRHVDHIIEEVASEFAKGCIAADPYQKGSDRTYCDWCDYQDACHFEPGEDCARYLYSVKGAAFWEAAGKGQEEP